jgi:hypothetical protein
MLMWGPLGNDEGLHNSITVASGRGHCDLIAHGILRWVGFSLYLGELLAPVSPSTSREWASIVNETESLKGVTLRGSA